MPLTSKNPTKQRRAEQAEQEESRFVADIPKSVHKQIRLRCAEDEIDQKTYFLRLVEADEQRRSEAEERRRGKAAGIK